MSDTTNYWPDGFFEDLTYHLEAGSFNQLDPEQLLEMYKRAAEDITSPLLAQPQKALMQERGDRAAFEARLVARWGYALALFDLTINRVLESGRQINSEYRPRAAERQDQKFEALIRLHGRAAMTAQEVLVLLRAGYASGALARWRTIHEIWVVVSLLRKSDSELSHRYLAHEAIESMKAQEEYERTWESLGFEPPDWTPSERDQLRSSLRDTFGPEFLKDYGWAAPLFEGAAPKLNKIERLAELGHWRGYYRMASHGVHANPKGVLWNLQGDNGENLVWAGPSNAGLIDPAQCPLIALVNVDTELVHYTIEELMAEDEIVEQCVALVGQQVNFTLMNSAIDSLVETQNEQETEEGEIRQLAGRAESVLAEEPGLTAAELATRLEVSRDRLEEALAKMESRGRFSSQTRYSVTDENGRR